MRERNPGDEIHEWSNEDLLIYYEEFMELLHEGKPDDITLRDRQDFDRLKAEILYRLAKELLDEGT